MILLEAFDATITEDTLTSIEATLYKDTIENIMIGLCQAFTGSDPWVAPAQKAYIRAQRMTLAGYSDIEVTVSCENCTEVDSPATVTTHYLTCVGMLE